MDFLGLLYFFGRAICHQIPERSFYISNIQMPICARDTGIYLGILSTLVILMIRKRHKANMIPTRTVSLFVLLLLVPMMLDGGTSYLGLRESNNILRIITGMLFGSVLPLFLVPLLNISKQEEKVGKIIRPTIWDIFLSLVLALGLAITFFIPIIHGTVLSVLLIFIVMIWFSMVVLLLFQLFGWNRFSTVQFITSGCLSLLILTSLSLLFDKLGSV